MCLVIHVEKQSLLTRGILEVRRTRQSLYFEETSSICTSDLSDLS